MHPFHTPSDISGRRLGSGDAVSNNIGNWYLTKWLEWLPRLEHEETPEAPPVLRHSWTLSLAAAAHRKARLGSSGGPFGVFVREWPLAS
jgi:hypothetical protein